MNELSLLSNAELLERMPKLVFAERARCADIIEHLIEIDQRRLYLGQACRSLSCYCIERLGYSEDEAAKRVTATRLCTRFPGLLAELGAGALHLTGICVLARYLTPENYDALAGQARGKTRREIEELIAASFPRPDVPDRMAPMTEQTTTLALVSPVGEIRPGTDPASEPSEPPSRVRPLSESRWSVQFTAGAELREKIERARELLSHAIPSGDLAALFERGLDALIAQETKRRLGAGKPRRRRPLSPGSRHVPVEVARQVWERDGRQCTFVDEQGHRCSARRFLTIEHREPFALGGPTTVENTCLLCSAHNQAAARQVFGAAQIAAKRKHRQVSEGDGNQALREKAHKALVGMGFRKQEVRSALAEIGHQPGTNELEPLLRVALGVLVP
jgi:hypothetical protein